MRVERQGSKIQVVLKEGNQERWFNIEEHEAQELALRLGEVLSEPKKPKFVVGDRVRVIEDNINVEGTNYLGDILTVKEVWQDNDVEVHENKWFWSSEWLERVER